MIQFIPSNLNLDELLQTNPPTFKYHSDNFIHLINLITEVPAKNKSNIDAHGFVRLSATLLKARIYNYKEHIDWLITVGVFESDRLYVPGTKCKGFRFAEKYQTPIAPVFLQKYTLKKSVNLRKIFDRDMKAKYNYLFKWLDERIVVDIKMAEEIIKAQYWKDKEVDSRSAINKYNHRSANVIALHKAEHYFRVDDTGYRLHTVLSRIWKELRPCISFDGKTLAAVDITACQPWLISVLLNQDFYFDDTAHPASIFNFSKGELNNIPIQQIKREVMLNEHRYVEFTQLFEGDFYLNVKEKLYSAGYRDPIIDENSNDIQIIRKRIKQVVYMILYSANQFIGQKEAIAKKLFKMKYPEVYSLLALYKQGDSRNLPILMQRLEAALVLDRAAKQFAKANPGKPIFTIHDSLVSLDGFQTECQQHLEAASREMFGKTVKTTPTRWVFND
jgi:hypothetical protein